MFGGKKIKEAQEQLEELQADYTKLTDSVRKTKSVSDEVFAVLKVQGMQLNQGLEGMNALLEENEKDAESYDMQTKKLAEELEEFIGAQKRREEAAQRQEQTIADAKATNERVRELEAVCLKAEEAKNAKTADFGELLMHSAEEIAGLAAAAKSMSVLALNAAIEAGRMGEAGMEFLSAAENIREQAENYHSRLQSVSEQVERMKDIHGGLELTETTEQMKRVLQEIKRQTNLLNEAGELLKDGTGCPCAQDLQEQKQAVEEIAEGMRRTEERRQSAFSQMELIGQNFTEAKKAKEELEEHLSGIYRELFP